MRVATLVAGTALAVALAAAAFLAFADSYSGVSCVATTAGESNCVTSSQTLIEENGSWVLLLVVLPVIFAALGFLAVLLRWDKYAGWCATVALFLYCVVLGFSIGFFDVPSLILLALAMFLDRRQARRETRLRDT